MKQVDDFLSDLQLLAAADDFLQAGQFIYIPGSVSNALQGNEGNEKAGNVLSLNEFKQQNGVPARIFADHDQRAAAGPGGEEFVETHIEAQWRELQRIVASAQARFSELPLHEVGQHFVSQGRAFGQPGGARGVDDVTQVKQVLRSGQI
ncbi:hypothetical protein APX70_01068 [Pseudomonas syringae pv. maculicola]|uniref:Uncharacterized protein n=1 Tax=Pseudomonas syringae pv. maculicola TaxID=59511 RepID=A0A3M3A8E1_PSEYM|nr:hypothetical protein APX70_01068 [Pseudomonas syringae pv. maculicola]